MSTGGSLEDVTFAGRTFAVASDADVSRMIGGYNNEIQSNGDGTARQIKTRVPWQVTGLQLSVDDSAGDHEFLQDLADRKGYFPISITYASGEVYQGRGQITNDLSGSSQNTTVAVDLSGPQKLERQI